MVALPRFPDFLSIAEATERSIQNAKHLRAIHSGPVATLRALAMRIDVLLANNGSDESGRLDNVSIPTYLKYCQALGLTPDVDTVQSKPSAGRPKTGIERFMESQRKKDDESKE